MTPNDIYNKKFEKAMGGYKAEDVNRFLIVMGDYVDDLLSDKAELEAKLEVLAEKIEEYRSDEESLRAAIVGAQKLGDSVVRESKLKAEAMLTEAKAKAEEIVADARYKAETLLDDTRRSIQTEEYALERIKSAVVKFRRQVMGMYEQQVKLINAIPFDETEAVEPEKPELLKKPAVPAPEAIPAGAKEAFEYDEIILEEEETTGEEPRPRQSHFGPLLFGEDFSLTRKD